MSATTGSSTNTMPIFKPSNNFAFDQTENMLVQSSHYTSEVVTKEKRIVLKIKKDIQGDTTCFSDEIMR